MSSVVISKAQPVNGSGGSGTVNDPIQFRVGDGNTYSPAAGATSYINPTLAGNTKYLIYRQSIAGYLQKAVDFNYRAGGGFDLIGSTFIDTELFSLSNI